MGPFHMSGENLEGTDDVVVFDAYAWCEYALDGPYAELVNEKLSSARQALTPASVIGELKESMLRHRVKTSKISSIILYVKNRSFIVNIDSEIAEKAGDINFEYKKKIQGWGMLDSIVYSVTLLKKGRVITGDPHFKKLPEVIYIGTDAPDGSRRP